MSLEIVVGPMFSGKSSYAVAYIRRQQAINKNVYVIKPDIDKRYSIQGVIVTHNEERMPCRMWRTESPLTLTEEMRQSDCIVFEEAQFFKGLKNTVFYLLKAYKKDVLIVGLDGDANQQPFGEILECIPLADSVIKLCALCNPCCDGTEAPYTKRISKETTEEQQVDVGGSEKYEAVCLKHLGNV